MRLDVVRVSEVVSSGRMVLTVAVIVVFICVLRLCCLWVREVSW